MVTSPKYARLNKEDLSKIQALEKETGKLLLAYEPNPPSPYAELKPEQIEKLRRFEQELGVILIAYKI